MKEIELQFTQHKSILTQGLTFNLLCLSTLISKHFIERNAAPVSICFKAKFFVLQQNISIYCQTGLNTMRKKIQPVVARVGMSPQNLMAKIWGDDLAGRQLGVQA